jgi:hypothetical protein
MRVAQTGPWRVHLPSATITLLIKEPKAMSADLPPSPEKTFRGWRLIGYIMCVIVVLAVVSGIVDWIVIGPLEGRMF